MTDYPTREAIDAAAETIEALQDHVDRDALGGLATWHGLETVRQILIYLDFCPGLHLPEPKPEPKPQRTASEVLAEAEQYVTVGSPEHHIIIAAYGYVKSNPEWFADWHKWPSAQSALPYAAYCAGQANDEIASAALQAAAIVAQKHPRLFVGGIV